MQFYLCNHKYQSLNQNRYQDFVWQCVPFYVVSGQGLIAKQNAPTKCFNCPFFLFACHAKPDYCCRTLSECIFVSLINMLHQNARACDLRLTLLKAVVLWLWLFAVALRSIIIYIIKLLRFRKVRFSNEWCRITVLVWPFSSRIHL